jgi:type II secretory pathway pseudopilin PulG
MKSDNKKAFTIVELLVAVGLLVAMMAASVVVFRTAIDAQQKAASAGDYMRAITAVTNQIRNDFQSLDSDAPFIVSFNRYGSDSIYFFTTGRFEQLSEGNIDSGSDVYTYGGIHYAADADMLLRSFEPLNRYTEVIIPSTNPADERDDLIAALNTDVTYNENMPSTYGNLLSDQIESIKIQMLYDSGNGTVRWYPDEDPYPQLTGDSDYDLMFDKFGVFFNIDATDTGGFYQPQALSIQLIKADGTLDNPIDFAVDYKPLAFKFIINVMDPNDKLENKIFTYVVRLRP